MSQANIEQLHGMLPASVNAQHGGAAKVAGPSRSGRARCGRETLPLLWRWRLSAHALVWGCALLLTAGQLLAQGPQVNLTGLSLKLPGDATLYPFTANNGSPNVWTLQAPPLAAVPLIDIHGSISLVGTLSNTSGSDIPMAFLGAHLPPGTPSWLTLARFNPELALPGSFYSAWTAPYLAYLATLPLPLPSPLPDPLVLFANNSTWTGTLFSINLDNVILDSGPADLALVTFDITDPRGNLRFDGLGGTTGTGASANFSVGDYTSPSLGIGAPEPGTIALALAALAMLGVRLLLNLRKRRQATTG